LAPPAQRQHLSLKFARRAAQPYGGHASLEVDSTLLGDDEYDGLIGRTSQVNGMCLAADGKAFDMALMRMHLGLLDAAEAAKAEEGKEEAAADDKEEK